MTWQLSIAFFFIFALINTLWSRVYAQKSKLPGKVPPALQYSLGLLPFGIIYALFAGNFHVTWSSSTILYLLLEGLFIGIFNWLAFIAYKRTKVAQYETVLQLYVIVAAALGWLLLHESLSIMQLAGGFLLFIGALIAANTHKEKQATRYRVSTGVILTLLAAVSLGIGLVAEKAALDRMTLSAYFIFGYGAQVLAALIIAAKDIRATPRSLYNRHELFSCLGLGATSAIVGFFYIYALTKSDNIALTTVATTFQLPLTVIGGYVILKEKDKVAQMAIACVVALAGLILCAR